MAGAGGDAQVQAVARSISAEGGTAGAFPADVTEEHEAAGLVAAISGTLGPVEVLVLNATGPQPEAPLSEVAWEPCSWVYVRATSVGPEPAAVKLTWMTLAFSSSKMGCQLGPTRQVTARWPGGDHSRMVPR